jgi:phage baseplate assembly protein W
MTKRNVVLPFRRDLKNDVASEVGSNLLISKVKQVLLTGGDTPRSGGELPWRTAFGASLGLLRHQASGAVLEELARVYVRDAITRWLPGVELSHLEVSHDDNALRLRLRVRETETEQEKETTTMEVPR